MVTKIAVTALVVLSCASCSKNKQGADYDPQLLLQAYSEPLTRYSTDAGFEAGDVVGVYVVKQNAANNNGLTVSGNYVDNQKFINEYSPTFGYVLKPEVGKEVYLVEEDTYDIYSYFPYITNLTSITELPFNVKTDQSAEVNFLGSDFLWAKTAQVKYKLSPVRVEYKHLFSQIIVSLVPGEGYTAEDINKLLHGVTIANVITDAKINLSDGKVAIGTQPNSIVSNRENAGGNVFRAMIIPQVVTNAKPFVDIEMGGKHYPVSLNLDFKSGRSYRMNVCVDKDFAQTVITLNGVVSWETEDLPDQDITVEDPSGSNIKKYCEINVTGDNSSAYVEGVTVGTFECGSSIGKTYIDYAHDLGVSAKVVNGEDIIVKFKNIDMPAEIQYRLYVFADWNNDGDFEDTKETIDMLGTKASLPNRVQPLPFTVDIPSGSVSPTTVRIAWGLYDETEAYNGCGHAVDGGVYDVAIEF